ncbi:cation:proton antiporter [Campylobacter sp. FMV-PI01]|uniref:Cation:proton antiporter n=1 Tax=Campylobacter portucalensis TaxID=2608384 RepID=A0A6L5WFW1_9BACT|nr:cation:proton antiporter [Campylobacter portucalensis]MSN95904.1 cation:proton antiporter [Campylobacter portucalensis]
MNEILLLITLSFVIFTSPYIANLIKLPISATEIILGIVLGSAGFLPENEYFKIVADVGFYYLMFLAGAKVDLKILLKTDKKILKLSLFYMLLLYIFTTIGVYSLNLNTIIIIIIPIMSVGILSTLYKEYSKDQIWLSMAMLVGVIGEVISIALLTILNAYSKYGLDIKLFINLSALIGFLVVTALAFRYLDLIFWWYPSFKKILMPQFDKNEKDIRLSISLLIFIIAVMMILELKIVVGSFIAGSLITTFFKEKQDLAKKLESFGFGFLVPIFFAYIGSTVNLDVILMDGVISGVVILSVVMLIARVLASFVFAKVLGVIGSVLFGISLNIPLTLLIATATIAYNANFISDKFYYILILASVFQAVVCITLIKIIYNFKKNKSKKLEN